MTSLRQTADAARDATLAFLQAAYATCYGPLAEVSNLVDSIAVDLKNLDDKRKVAKLEVKLEAVRALLKNILGEVTL